MICKSCRIKDAIIRGDNTRPCPFNLPIPSACKSVGKAIYRMEPVEGKKDTKRFEKANKLIYFYYKDGSKCPFADSILEGKFEKVDCDYGDNGAGRKDPPITGSPLYPSTFHSLTLNGIYGKPLGWYSDNDSARNMFFGLFSYLGKLKHNDIIKTAHTLLNTIKHKLIGG